MDVTYLGIFSAGLLTFLTPCVLPLIPIYLSVLVGAVIATEEKIDRFALLIRTIFFSIGFIFVFTLLGLGATAIGGFLIMHQATLQVAGGLVILLFGLKFLGYLQIPFLDRTLRINDSQKSSQMGPISALGMGFVFALGWSPCVGPMLGAVLTYTATTTSDVLTGAAYLTVYGLGFAIPLLLVASFAQAGVGWIRKLNRHLPTFEKVSGVLLLLVGLSMIFGNVTGGATIDPGFKLTQTAADQDTQPTPGENGNPMFVEFYRDDCPVCKKMAVVMASLSSDCSEHAVDIVKINVSKEENRKYISRYALRGVPTFIGYDKNGEVAKRLVGEQSGHELRDMIVLLTGMKCDMDMGDIDEPFDALSDPATEISCDGTQEASPHGNAACDI